MFGYIQYNKEEFTERDFNIYHSYYCGLCKSLKTLYGMKSSRVLSNDLTFVQILLSSLFEPEETVDRERCIINPLRKVEVRRNKYDDYVAKMNIVLSTYKALDDVNDEGKNKKLLDSLTPAFQKVKAEYPDKVVRIDDALRRITSLEKQKTTDLDLMCNTFGKVMGEIVSYPDDIWKEELYEFGYHLGKFIYLMDAYDDLDTDIKNNLYNPLKDMKDHEDFEESIESILSVFMGDATQVFESLPILKNAEILRNILYSGVWSRFEAIKVEHAKEKK